MWRCPTNPRVHIIQKRKSHWRSQRRCPIWKGQNITYSSSEVRVIASFLIGRYLDCVWGFFFFFFFTLLFITLVKSFMSSFWVAYIVHNINITQHFSRRISIYTELLIKSIQLIILMAKLTGKQYSCVWWRSLWFLATRPDQKQFCEKNWN